MRICSICQSEMTEGYCYDDGTAYYCTDTCLNKVFSDEEWNELYEEGGTSYWTQWEEDDIL